jgi:hypothetical protein
MRELPYWMPISAVIDVETMRRHWRNVHRFTGYKRFCATIRVENLETKPWAHRQAYAAQF